MLHREQLILKFSRLTIHVHATYLPSVEQDIKIIENYSIYICITEITFVLIWRYKYRIKKEKAYMALADTFHMCYIYY